MVQEREIRVSGLGTNPPLQPDSTGSIWRKDATDIAMTLRDISGRKFS